MKWLPHLIFTALLSLTSCTSEYEERVVEGKHLKEKLARLEANEAFFEMESAEVQKSELYNQIVLLSKVSGNEELFLKEVFGN